MADPAPSSPEEPRKNTSSLLTLGILLAIFMVIVFVVAVLLLPDRGRNLLKLTMIGPVPQTLAALLP